MQLIIGHEQIVGTGLPTQYTDIIKARHEGLILIKYSHQQDLTDIQANSRLAHNHNATDNIYV